MDRNEASEIVRAILSGTARVVRTEHFKLRLEERGYTMLDVRRVLASGRIEREPERDPDRGNHKVLVRGNSWNGRDTRIVLALRSAGANFYITIIDIEHLGPRVRGGRRK